MSQLPTDEMSVRSVQSAIEAMQAAKDRGLIEGGRVRYGIAKNIRLHQNAIEEAEADLEDLRESFSLKDEDGRRVYQSVDNRRVVETDEGMLVYVESGKSYISDDDHRKQVRARGREMSEAEYKRQALQPVFTDVRTMQTEMTEIRERTVEVKIHVIDDREFWASMAGDTPGVREEDFLHVMSGYRQASDLSVGGFEPWGEPDPPASADQDATSSRPEGESRTRTEANKTN